jgi:hypothetical protein
MWCKVGDLEAEFCSIVNFILRTPRWQLASWRGATASEHCRITRQCVVGVAIYRSHNATMATATQYVSFRPTSTTNNTFSPGAFVVNFFLGYQLLSV